MPHFPEVVANAIIDGETYKLTPQNNANVNAWGAAIAAGALADTSKTETELLKQYQSWTEEDIDNVAHFWGPYGSGGGGWGSHSTRPVPVYYQGDDGCIDALTGADFSVIGKTVKGSPGKLDQTHIHACMLKNLFGL